jgi:zinc D-Ala-D-Ala carboxypeptidase
VASEKEKARAVTYLALATAFALLVFRRPSKNFSWAELTRTDTGLPNNPTLVERVKLIMLAREVLQPIRDHFGPITVTSAYRSPEVNAALEHSAKDSDHLRANAADIFGPPGVTAQDLAAWLYYQPQIPLSQVIIEPSGHLHLSRVDREGNSNRQFLIFPTWTTSRPWAPGMIS